MPPSTLTPAIERPIIRTHLPGPNAKRLIAEDSRLISPSYTRSYPLVAKRGRGVVIRTSTATNSSTSPPASPSPPPDTAIPRLSPPCSSRPASFCTCPAQTSTTRSSPSLPSASVFPDKVSGASRITAPYGERVVDRLCELLQSAGAIGMVGSLLGGAMGATEAIARNRPLPLTVLNTALNVGLWLALYVCPPRQHQDSAVQAAADQR